MKYKVILLIVFLSFLDSYSQIDDCSSCDKIKLTAFQLRDKTVEELSLLRNEIFARNGYVFESQKFQRYFENKDWYNALNRNDLVVTSDIETYNIKYIKRLENLEKFKRTKGLNDLLQLKEALNNNDKEVIRTYIPEEKITNDWGKGYDGFIKELKYFLSKIDLKNIYWNQKSGYYKFSIDNGYAIYSYKLIFSKNEVRIGGGMYSHSLNFGDFDDGYSDYMSEGENQSFWVFKLTDTGLIFDHLEILG